MRDSMRSGRKGRTDGWGGVAACVLLAGCAFVELTEAGKGVSEVLPEQVAECEKVATTRARVLDRVVWIDRSATRVARELRDLARNEAAAQGGNRVVATSPIERGGQSFDIYRCPAGDDA